MKVLRTVASILAIMFVAVNVFAQRPSTGPYFNDGPVNWLRVVKDVADYPFFGTIQIKKKIDSACVKYSFQTGDTMKYAALAYDSIIIDGQGTLTKTRLEDYHLICDSVGVNGRFYMKMILVFYKSYEFSSAETEGVETDESPWLNRVVRFEIDSLGKKYSYFYDNPNNFAVNPGGAFRQALLPDLGESCKGENESWLYKTAVDVPENACPPSFVDYKTLYRMKTPKDTLNHKCNVVEYTRIQQGRYELKEFLVGSYANTWGRLLVSKETGIPVFMNATSEQKLEIFSGKNKQKGKHYENTTYKLVEVKKAAPVQKPGKEAKPKKNVKKKK